MIMLRTHGIERRISTRNRCRFALIVTCLVAFAIAGCMDQSANYPTSPNPGGNPSPNTVTMSSMAFSPSTLTVSRGTTVTWKNTDGIAHTATSDAGVWDTGNMPAGSSKTFTFNTTGTYSYFCTYHRAMGMVGTIIVQ